MKTINYEGIIVHNIEKHPEGLEYCYSVISELSEYELKSLIGKADECWYWYSSGDYEGSGQMLIRKGNMFAIEDLGHCSCYGPLEDIEDLKFNKLEDIQMSDGFYTQVKPLIDFARSSKNEQKEI